MIIPNHLQIESQTLEIGELVDKRLGEGLVLQQIVKHQFGGAMENLIPLKNYLQGYILIIQPKPLPDLIGLLKLTKILKMLLSQVLQKLLNEQIEDQYQIQVPTLIMKDHLLKARIHPPQETQDQEREIIVQDLMINNFSIY